MRRLARILIAATALALAPPAVEASALREAGSLYFTRPALATYVATRAKLEVSARAVFALVAGRVLRPNIHARYALADAAKAHADLEAGRTAGASLLIP